MPLHSSQAVPGWQLPGRTKPFDSGTFGLGIRSRLSTGIRTRCSPRRSVRTADILRPGAGMARLESGTWRLDKQSPYCGATAVRYGRLDSARTGHVLSAAVATGL